MSPGASSLYTRRRSAEAPVPVLPELLEAEEEGLLLNTQGKRNTAREEHNGEYDYHHRHATQLFCVSLSPSCRVSVCVRLTCERTDGTTNEKEERRQKERRRQQQRVRSHEMHTRMHAHLISTVPFICSSLLSCSVRFLLAAPPQRQPVELCGTQQRTNQRTNERPESGDTDECKTRTPRGCPPPSLLPPPSCRLTMFAKRGGGERNR
jgi:hypothetical protein